MQLAINILVFFLGLCIATVVAKRSRDAKKSIPETLREIASGLVIEKSSSELHEPCRERDEQSQHGSRLLLTKEQIEQNYDLSSWQRLAYEDFKTTILAKETGLKTFPCIYATMGFRAGDHRYLFLESDDPSEPRNVRLVAPALRAYLRMSKTLGANTSMVIMAAPTEGGLRTVEEYNQGFWEMLRGLRIGDSKPWPEDFPEDTNSEKWTYCFDGTPIFPVALTPAHERRWSRHSSVPTIALQPKWVLDKLLDGPEAREAATGKVRKLLKQYDQIDISPDLTSYGQAGTSEVHQLCLRDENETAECPYDNFDRGGTPRSSIDNGRRSSRY